MPATVREQPRKRRDEGTVGAPQPPTLMLASQDPELVPQQHEFHVLGELGPSTPNEQPHNSGEGKVSEGEEHRPILPARANAPTGLGALAQISGFWYSRARETIYEVATSRAATEQAVRT
jgi:hypothetical protein